jgi:hypothetical protein
MGVTSSFFTFDQQKSESPHAVKIGVLSLSNSRVPFSLYLFSAVITLGVSPWHLGQR